MGALYFCMALGWHVMKALWIVAVLCIALASTLILFIAIFEGLAFDNPVTALVFLTVAVVAWNILAYHFIRWKTGP